MRIAVVGAGSLGVVIGGLLTKSGRDVDLVAAHEETVSALNSKGAVIRGAIEAVIPVKAITPAQMCGIYDYVLLLTKQNANDAALIQLLPHLNENSVVCTLQNGVPEGAVSGYVGMDRTVGGVVLVGATRQGPGVSLITASLEIMIKCAFLIGEINGDLTARIYEIRDLLSPVGGCSVVNNLMEIRWAKLLVNAAIGGATAMLGCPFKDILKDSRAMNIFAHIADETIKTAHACGYHLAQLLGKDLESLELKHTDKVDDKIERYRNYFEPYANSKGSMLQDLESSRKTEVNYINGYICKMGQEKNVPTPYNQVVVRLVTESERQGNAPDFITNLRLAERYLNESE